MKFLPPFAFVRSPAQELKSRRRSSWDPPIHWAKVGSVEPGGGSSVACYKDAKIIVKLFLSRPHPCAPIGDSRSTIGSEVSIAEGSCTWILP